MHSPWFMKPFKVLLVMLTPMIEASTLLAKFYTDFPGVPDYSHGFS